MGGGQNLLIGLAGIQQKMGHDVTVLALEPCADTLVRKKIEAEGVGVDVLTERISLFIFFLLSIGLASLK